MRTPSRRLPALLAVVATATLAASSPSLRRAHAGSPPAAHAAATPAPTPVDVSAVKDKLTVVTDGKGHYLALVPFSTDENSHFYGDGKRLFSLPLHGGGGTMGEQWSVNFAEPRVRSPSEATVDFTKGRYSVTCAGRTTALTAVPAAEGKKLIAAASFERSPRQWRAYALARDTAGKYYFVDRGRWPETERNFRLFVGPKGNLKQQKMTNVVSDSEGDIFATRTGSLRLVLNKSESSWIERGKPTKLLLVPVEDNITMIYNELGVYAGERLGTPCDDL